MKRQEQNWELSEWYLGPHVDCGGLVYRSRFEDRTINQWCQKCGKFGSPVDVSVDFFEELSPSVVLKSQKRYHPLTFKGMKIENDLLVEELDKEFLIELETALSKLSHQQLKRTATCMHNKANPFAFWDHDLATLLEKKIKRPGKQLIRSRVMEETVKESTQVGPHLDCGGTVFSAEFTQKDNKLAAERYCGRCGRFGEVKVDGLDNVEAVEATEETTEEVTDIEVTVN